MSSRCPSSSSRAVPEQLLGLRVDELDSAVRADDHHRVGRAIEQVHVVLGQARQLDLLGHVFEAMTR